MSLYSSAGKIASFSPPGVVMSSVVMGVTFLPFIDCAARPDIRNDDLCGGLLEENAEIADPKTFSMSASKFGDLAQLAQMTERWRLSRRGLAIVRAAIELDARDLCVEASDGGVVLAAHARRRRHEKHLQGGSRDGSRKRRGARHVRDDAEILGEDRDGALRRVVIVEDVRDAVLEHPRVSSRSGDDFIDLREVEPELLGEGDRFASGGDMHAREKLVDHFEGGARAGFAA